MTKKQEIFSVITLGIFTIISCKDLFDNEQKYVPYVLKHIRDIVMYPVLWFNVKKELK